MKNPLTVYLITEMYPACIIYVFTSPRYA